MTSPTTAAAITHNEAGQPDDDTLHRAIVKVFEEAEYVACNEHEGGVDDEEEMDDCDCGGLDIKFLFEYVNDEFHGKCAPVDIERLRRYMDEESYFEERSSGVYVWVE